MLGGGGREAEKPSFEVQLDLGPMTSRCECACCYVLKSDFSSSPLTAYLSALNGSNFDCLFVFESQFQGTPCCINFVSTSSCRVEN